MGSCVLKRKQPAPCAAGLHPCSFLRRSELLLVSSTMSASEKAEMKKTGTRASPMEGRTLIPVQGQLSRRRHIAGAININGLGTVCEHRVFAQVGLIMDDYFDLGGLIIHPFPLIGRLHRIQQALTSHISCAIKCSCFLLCSILRNTPAFPGIATSSLIRTPPAAFYQTAADKILSPLCFNSKVIQPQTRECREELCSCLWLSVAECHSSHL